MTFYFWKFAHNALVHPLMAWPLGAEMGSEVSRLDSPQA